MNLDLKLMMARVRTIINRSSGRSARTVECSFLQEVENYLTLYEQCERDLRAAESRIVMLETQIETALAQNRARERNDKVRETAN
ncbi:MAG: hypothetical protein KDJ69_16790 [Nitratireductor sp.]|nr:hypothetical protein [Nitratireductor sp.]